MIKSYRDGSSSKSSFTGEFLKSCDYDKEVERKLSKVKKPFLEIDWLIKVFICYLQIKYSKNYY